uniref:Uncharacterized protein n=1 Tax=Labrus bergylta TaxID=56723 RepID=A0A3Q3F544_9LABR
MDEALLTVNNEVDTEVVVSWVSDRCYQCLYQQLGVVPAGSSPGQPSSADFIVSTQHQMTLQLNNTSVKMEVPFHFGEHGNYSLWVKNLNDSSVVNCSVVTDEEAFNSYIRESRFHTACVRELDGLRCIRVTPPSVHTAVLIAFVIFAGLALMSTIGRTIYG